MKAVLICPSIRPGVRQLAEEGPLASLPIFGQSLASHWIEHLAVLGAKEVRIVAADRASQLRTALGDGARWGVRLEVTAAGAEPTPAEAAACYRPSGETGWLPSPDDIVIMNFLPGCPDLPLFESHAGWYAALLAWMPRTLTPARVRMNEIRPGIWVGRRAHISPVAELIAPCWIGDQAFVGAGATVGPGAIIEDRSVVENDARVAQSWVGPDTFVGPMTSVASSLAWGSSLIDWRSDSSLRVPDPFLLCSLASPAAPAAEPLRRAALAPKRAAARFWPRGMGAADLP
jgi:hypothetical protein